MKKRYWISILVISLIGLFFFSFIYHPGNKETEDKTIILGSSPGPYSDLFLQGIKPILEKEGYTVKNKSFASLLNADIALNEGQVDLSVDQHTAYMKNFNNEKKANLTALNQIPTVPTGIYPAQKDNLDAISNGDKIAIPDDPSNTARAYRLMEKAGWITLKKDVNPIKVGKKDITSNKYNLNITEMNSSTIPRSKNDFDFIILTGSDAYEAKISTKKILLAENIQPDYFLIATINKKNTNKPWAKAVTKAYQSTEFAEYVKNHNQDNYWIMPNK
ncbi:MetQ/NlpA family ABC transporter substrate-binding protein [Convivina intestini]|uniref:D-methionine transport system substrate-binding protein n=1 Tax=Convivina intestini TaxID=1505726 RepID=A0A2U1D6F1_9LACO|nr:MetQ/NlpA family ABC transporter substrate-binding protein [Convivina intestini]PVY83169.1 D-methionine transport system substrate-binding protein [Convivina intestini]CAH1856200.1 Membrane lipoprotein TpN32 [Convivina intestini]SDB95891.1 D-methionine transport system substrate-binding protein [Leuconostocaceae bacterium R-53105]